MTRRLRLNVLDRGADLMAAFKFGALAVPIVEAVEAVEAVSLLRTRDRSSVFLAEDFALDSVVCIFGREDLDLLGEGILDRLMRLVGRSSSLSSLSSLDSTW